MQYTSGGQFQVNNSEGDIPQLRPCNIAQYANHSSTSSEVGDSYVSDSNDNNYSPSTRFPDQAPEYFGDSSNQNRYNSDDEYAGQQSYTDKHEYEENSIYENPDKYNLRSDEDGGSDGLSDGGGDFMVNRSWPVHSEDMESDNECNNNNRMRKGVLGGGQNKVCGRVGGKGKGVDREVDW